MTKGSSPTLLIEEIIELLLESGKLTSLALDVQSSDFLSGNVKYCLAWYLYNLRTTVDQLVGTVSALEVSEGKTRSTSDFLKLAHIHEPPADQTSLHDLESAHKAFDNRLKATLLSYRETIEINRPILVIVNLCEKYWELCANTLQQARKEYER